MSRPILFLDIDGVLNSHAWFSRRPEKPFENWANRIDPAAVGLLNQLIDRVPDVQFVLSSSWRLYHELDVVRALLRERGFVGEIIDKTPHLLPRRMSGPGRPRGEEIALWRESNQHTGPFVILDDDSDMGDLLPHLVKTRFGRGLTQVHVDRAVKALTGAGE